jgi:predicted TIM-barrel fold metal-dependent hydrolase
MQALGYQIVDADNHYYDADDCFTRHIESRYRERTINVNRSYDDGIGRMFIGGERLAFFSAAVGDHIGPPGAMKAFFNGETETGGAPNLNPMNVEDYPEFTDRKRRLVKMDEQGVEAAIMIPTLGVGVEPELRNKDREILYPSLRAFNRWVEEDWGFGEDGRIISPALISMVDPLLAVEEIDRVIAAGCRAVILTTGPVDGKSPADPFFDPIWARLEEAEIPVIYHLGSTEFPEMYASHWGENPNPASHRQSLLTYYMAFAERPVSDTIAALLAHNLFGRFPNLRVISIENGSAWVAPTLKKLQGLTRLTPNRDTWRFGAPDLRPLDQFRRNVWVAPYPEDDIDSLVTLIGAERVLNGSDFPHPEGLLHPHEFVESLKGFTNSDIRAIMRDNAAELLKLA